MILVLVALIMVGISFVMPWYSLTAEISSTVVSSSMDTDYYLDHAEMEAMGETQTIDYEDTEGDSKALDVFNTTKLMVILGIVGCIIGLIGAAMVMVGKMSNKLGTILVLIALILTVLAPIYMMFALPAAFDEDMGDTGGEGAASGMGESFFGSEKSETDLGSAGSMTTEYTWGGGTGWIMAFIAFILLIVALIMVVKSTTPEPAPMAPAQPAPQPAYQPPQPPPSQQP